MTAELKRELVDHTVQTVAELPDRTSPDDQPDMMLVTAEELTAILNAEVDHLFQRLAAGSPEVIEAMARGMWESRNRPWPWIKLAEATREMVRHEALAALAAGMKVIAEGGE